MKEQNFENEFDDDYMDYEVNQEPEHEYCPKCGRYYDHIDFDYQSCSKCGWDAEVERYDPKIKIEPTEDDYLNGDADILTGRLY